MNAVNALAELLETMGNRNLALELRNRAERADRVEDILAVPASGGLGAPAATRAPPKRVVSEIPPPPQPLEGPPSPVKAAAPPPAAAGKPAAAVRPGVAGAPVPVRRPAQPGSKTTR